MEATNLKDIMQNINQDIKQFRTQLEDRTKSFNLNEFLHLLDSETGGKLNLSDFCNLIPPVDTSESTQNNSSSRSIPISSDVPINISNDKVNLSSLKARLVKNEEERKIINEEIEKLNCKDKKLFWALYHDIPLDETSIKLDTVISSIATLNANIVNNFNYKERLENILDEIEILRKEFTPAE